MDVLRKTLLDINRAALAAVAPDGAVLRHLVRDGKRLALMRGSEPDMVLDLSSYRRIVVLGAGKGAAPMAQALENLLGDHIDEGLVIVKYGHGLPKEDIQRIDIVEAAHPVPDEAGQRAATSLVERAATLAKGDLAFLLFTGGASALTPALQPDISLADLQRLTSALLACGATIHEINTLRKHLSRLSGGELARAVFPARGIGLIVSDVVGDNLDVIASGPTVPDSSTFADCKIIVEKYGLAQDLPRAIARHLDMGLQGSIHETPKAGDKLFSDMHNVLVATLRQALEAAGKRACELGFAHQILTDTLTGEARDAASLLVYKAREIQKTLAPDARPVCLLAGGETTVTIRGRGLGGRNQEMALAAGLELASDEGIYALFVGTDGTDGPTDAAGGFAMAGEAGTWPQMGVDGAAFLRENDSYHCLEKTGNLYKSGPTRTNVMDAAIILVYPKRG